MSNVEFKSLKGLTFSKVERNGDAIHFINDTHLYNLEHQQDCCENVYIESIVGDLSDLENTPILLAEEIVNVGDSNDYDSSCTYSFYKLATIKGYVDIRFIGESNGYYSETVDLDKRIILSNDMVEMLEEESIYMVDFNNIKTCSKDTLEWYLGRMGEFDHSPEKRLVLEAVKVLIAKE